MTIKTRVRQLCANAGISMNTLEKEIGVARGYMSKLDKVTPNGLKIKKIADYFGVSADYILYGHEATEKKPYYLSDETSAMAQEIFDNNELRMLFSTVKDAEPEDIKFVHDMFLALKKREAANAIN